MARKNYTTDDVHRLVSKRFRRFYAVLVAVIFIPLLLVIFKLADIQVVNAEYYQQKASQTRNQSLTVFRRGRILDRNGHIMAQDVTLYDVYAHPRYYYDTGAGELAKAMAPILNQPEAQLVAKLQQPYDTIRLASNLDKKTAKLLRDKHLPGIDIPRKMVRRYPQGTLAAHILGYVNDDAKIATGIEQAAVNQLKSAPPVQGLERSPDGSLIHVDKVDTALVTDIPQADDVQLSIDSRVQFIAERALESGLERTKAQGGMALVMDPTNGEILAFAVKPDFNPNQFRKASATDLKNWAITDVYPPGSTFKILTVASGLETGVINRQSILHDSGRMVIQNQAIENYDYKSHGAPGNIDLIYLLQHSSNIGSLLISLRMDPIEHYELLKKMGFGSRTQIEIPGESAGILHHGSKWDESTHASIGFGYGIAATPLQMASAVASIANGGVWVTPHVMKNNANVKRHRVITDQTARTVTELLSTSIGKTHSVVNVPGLNVAGKTGTSRKPVSGGYGNDLYTSFVGYFPANDPRVLVMVVVDSPRIGNAWGSTVAGPIFKEIATNIAGYLGVGSTATQPAEGSAKPAAASVAAPMPESLSELVPKPAAKPRNGA
ncbi:MAG: penicillin-binding protein 2 [Cyanobacteria bacterium HKST-UBA04]|nr:penicillin-binding protein 2 [Cyanobacteria bacterium HKST-UBA04]